MPPVSPASCGAFVRFAHNQNPVKPGMEVQPGIDLEVFTTLFLPPGVEDLDEAAIPTYLILPNLSTRILVSDTRPAIAANSSIVLPETVTITPGVQDEAAGAVIIRIRHGGWRVEDELSWSEVTIPIRTLVGDANRDGTVDVDDLIAVQQRWGEQLSTGDS